MHAAIPYIIGFTSFINWHQLKKLNPHFVSTQDIARYLRPNTIRAKFGINSIKNAIHCTDLPEDVPLEVILRKHFLFRLSIGVHVRASQI